MDRGSWARSARAGGSARGRGRPPTPCRHGAISANTHRPWSPTTAPPSETRARSDARPRRSDGPDRGSAPDPRGPTLDHGGSTADQRGSAPDHGGRARGRRMEGGPRRRPPRRWPRGVARLLHTGTAASDAPAPSSANPAAPAPSDPDDAAATPRPPPPRCTPVSAAPFVIGDAPPAARGSEQGAGGGEADSVEDIAPFAVEVGRGTTFSGGFAVGAQQEAEGGTVAMVATLSADGAQGKLVRLARLRGDMDPPVSRAPAERSSPRCSSRTPAGAPSRSPGSKGSTSRGAPSSPRGGTSRSRSTSPRPASARSSSGTT